MPKEEIKEHQLYISGIRVIWRLWRENKANISSKKIFFKIAVFTLLSAPFRWLQNTLYSRKIHKIDLYKSPPVFVIGHWRSGTTHLHYLLAKDPQFGHLEAFQAFFFRIALVSKKTMRPLLNKLMPKTRPQDNVTINAGAPTEEEHPLTNLTHRSAMHSFFFPNNQHYFQKYHLFNTSKISIDKWSKTYKKMLQGISFYNGDSKTLLLKNPHNTARIKVLLKMFPNAKFIYIHRDPFEVYQSTVHLYKSVIRSQFLEELSDEQISECVITTYELVMKQYLELRACIPEGQLSEVSYANLSQDPMSTMKNIYTELNLGDFAKIKPIFESYINSQKNYRKNKFKDLPNDLKKRLTKRWGFAFKAWDYPY